jgi:putrescine transport system permease protein
MNGVAGAMRRLVIGTPYLWLVILFLVPFFIVLRISLSEPAIAIPPYSPILDTGAGWGGIKEFFAQLDFENYAFLATDDLYWKAYLSSLKIATISTVLCVLVGFPIAYGMANAAEEWRPTLIMLVILPFWTSFLIRVYAWMGILGQDGVLNQFLLATGIIGEPLSLLNTNIAVYIGIVYTYCPFMILPIYASLEKLDGSLMEAAVDLGANRLTGFWLITIPLAKPGVIAGCFLVFIPALGEFVIPSLLGGSDTLMIGKVLWEEFFSNRDWPVAAAVAIILLLILIVPIILFQRNQEKQQEAGQ